MTNCVKELKWCVSLPRMLFAAVSCICVSGRSNCFDDGSSTCSRRVFCSGGTCWWNILTLSYEQQRCHSSVTSDWWTIYVGEFSVTGWTASSRHLYCCDVRCYCFNDCWCNIFRHPSIIFFTCNLVDEHSSSLHSLGRRRLPHQDCCWNFESWLTTFRVYSEKLCNIVNCSSRLVMILLLWQPIVICDYPPIP